MKTLTLLLLTATLAHASVQKGKGTKYHALNSTNQTVTVCGYTNGLSSIMTNVVDCKRCLKPRK